MLKKIPYFEIVSRIGKRIHSAFLQSVASKRSSCVRAFVSLPEKTAAENPRCSRPLPRIMDLAVKVAIVTFPMTVLRAIIRLIRW